MNAICFGGSHQVMEKLKRKTSFLQSTLCAVFGCFLYAAGYRLILVPLNLFSGGLTGVCQIVLIAVQRLFHVTIPTGFDLVGLLLWLINIPLFFLASKCVRKPFLIKTIITVLCQSLFMTFIPVPEIPLISDTLTSVIVGGAISGFGVGFTLKYGSCGGGTDIIGIYCAKNYPSFSVGNLTLIVNVCVYFFSFMHGSVETMVYSVIYSIVASMMMDRGHDQNVMVTAFIFSQNPNIGDLIIDKLHRGATCWNGYGCYKRQPMLITMTTCSRYECKKLLRMIKKEDPDAFITFSEDLGVAGNFEKRFDTD